MDGLVTVPKSASNESETHLYQRKNSKSGMNAWIITPH